jgi:hypothetical protein
MTTPAQRRFANELARAITIDATNRHLGTLRLVEADRRGDWVDVVYHDGRAPFKASIEVGVTQIVTINVGGRAVVEGGVFNADKGRPHAGDPHGIDSESEALHLMFIRNAAADIAGFVNKLAAFYAAHPSSLFLRPGPVHGFGSEGAPPRFWLNLARELGVALRVHGFYVDDTGNEGPTTHANGVRIHVEGKAGRMTVEVSGTTRLEEIKVGWRRILDAGQINPREVANRPRYGADADAERDALNRLYVNRDAEGLARFVASATEAYDHAQLLEHQSGAAAHARYKLRRGLAAAFGLFRPR